MPIKHLFVNPKADSVDTTITRPVDWNDDHEIEPGTEFDTPILDTPTIDDFTEALHTHADAANGGPVTSAPPSGTAGGDLEGTYPNPAVNKITVGSDADGDMYYRSSGILVRLPKGTALQKLQMNSGATAPEWTTASSTNGFGVTIAASSWTTTFSNSGGAFITVTNATIVHTPSHASNPLWLEAFFVITGTNNTAQYARLQDTTNTVLLASMTQNLGGSPPNRMPYMMLSKSFTAAVAATTLALQINPGSSAMVENTDGDVHAMRLIEYRSNG